MKKTKTIGKKAQVDGLYQLVLVIGLVAIVAAVLLVVLQNLSASSALDESTVEWNENFTSRAATAVNNTITGLSSVPNTWLSLIVTISVLVVIVILVLKGFGAMRTR